MASAYPSVPNPDNWPIQTGAMTEVCLNGSRLCMFEIWISITGTLNGSNRITQSNAVMRKCTWIEDDAIEADVFRFMDFVD